MVIFYSYVSLPEGIKKKKESDSPRIYIGSAWQDALGAANLHKLSLWPSGGQLIF